MNIIYEIKSGKVLSLCEFGFSEGAIETATKDGTLAAALCPSVFATDTHYISNGTAVAIPEKPSSDAWWEFDYATKTWVSNIEQCTRFQHKKRNALLAQSDWTQLPDVPLATKEAWTIYRQQLRDISTQVGFPTQIEWPTKPS